MLDVEPGLVILRAMTKHISALLAGLALVLGWGALLFTVFGSTYGTASSGVDGNGVVIESSGSASLMEVGLSPTTIFFLALFALAYLAVFGGAIAATRGRARARWLMVVGLVPLLGLGAISMGLVLALPATALALAATVMAFTRRPAGV